jgi:transcription elongation GreA/GreB family factor
MKEEFEKLASAGKIRTADVEALVQMATEGFCVHKSWGFGQVKTIDVVLGKMTVDFTDRINHSIDLAFAPKILTPIAKEHIEARKATDMDGLKQMAALHHDEVIKVIVDSYGNLATTDKVKEALVPDVIDPDDYKKWWETARREMKKGGCFKVPTKKTEAIEYKSEDTPLQDRLQDDFNAARGLKARLSIATEITKSAADLGDKNALAEVTLTKLNEEIQSHLKTQPALALESVMVRDELAQALGAEAGETAPNGETVWAAGAKLSEVVPAMPASRQHRALQTYQATHEAWPQAFLGLITQVPARLVNECVGLLSEAGHKDELTSELNQLINHHGAPGELLLWLVKDKSGDFASLLTPEAFGAMLTAIERETSDEKRASKLRDFLLTDPKFFDMITSGVDIEVVKDITRAVQMSTCFEGMDKRSVLGKILKAHPEIQSFITHGDKDKADKQPSDASIIVSWASLERKKLEFEELVQKKIPANSKEIEIAREYGDLRENAEFKAAKEQQKVLMTLQAEMEADIDRARGINYDETDTSAANVGTQVALTNLDTDEREEFALLGAWDGDPDNNLISYLTPMGQAIFGSTVGQEVELQLGDETRRLRVESISAYAP